MTVPIPDWLKQAVGEAPGKGSLTIAEIGDERSYARSGFSLTSAAFSHNEMLDPSFTASEEDAVAPPLEWASPPPGTQEIVLVVEDPDAPATKDGKALCHWVVWGFPGQKGKLLEGETPPRTGKNAKGNSEWLLPEPPVGDPPHRYVFQLFALDLPLVEMPGAKREQIVDAMRGHVLSCTVLVGRFEAGADDDDFADDESYAED